MRYKQVTVKTDHNETELVSCAMIDAGSAGASVTDGEDIKEVLRSKGNWDYYDESLGGDLPPYAFVTGCFDEDADLTGLENTLRAYLGREAEITVSVKDSADWENEWKKYYSPLDFGSVVVVPKWLDGKYDKPEILIDPGMAFGTGLHESTGMCLKLLSKTDVRGKTVLDVGCGSGILGIAALALGAEKCTFIDIDPQAVEATEANLACNGMSAEVICGDLAEKYDGKADIVLANLTADILLRLKSSLPGVMSDDGCVIMSGIIDARAGDVENGFFCNGFAKTAEAAENGWRAYKAVKG